MKKNYGVKSVFLFKAFCMYVLLLSTASAIDNAAWLNHEGKRPWLDIPFKEWPVFSQDKPKIVTKKIEYFDTGIAVDYVASIGFIWLDNNRFFINHSYFGGDRGKVSSELYDYKLKVIKELSADKMVDYVDYANGVIDLRYSFLRKDESSRVYRFVEAEDGEFKPYDEDIKINSLNRYKKSSPSIACQSFTPDGEERVYIKGSVCRQYFRLIKVSDSLGKKSTDYATRLFFPDGVSKAVSYNGREFSFREITSLSYYNFLDKYSAGDNYGREWLHGSDAMFALIDKTGETEVVEFPRDLIKKTNAKGRFLLPGYLGEPLAPGLLVLSDINNYLVTPYQIKKLEAPTEAVFVDAFSKTRVLSPDGCKIVYLSRRHHGINIFSYLSPTTIKIKNYCQGE